MSAYLVNQATLQSAVEAVLIGEDTSWKDRLEFDAKAVTALGRELFDLNQIALAARYGDNGEEPTFKGRAFSAVADGGDANVQRFKSLQCLIYQCSEGDVPETDLFKRISAAGGKLAAIIVSKSPAYDKAGWGVR